jgi:hypothetical protein
LLVPLSYLLTLARGLVFGDPTEYTFVANILGIAHPPGYAFYTLLGKAAQAFAPLADIPVRMHLLSAAAGTGIAPLVYLTVLTVAQGRSTDERPGSAAGAAAAFAGLSAAFGANLWQHAIHANPHIVTALFMAAELFLLTRWWAARTAEGERPARPDRWLIAFSFTAGLGLTHHPLTVFSLPACALFVLWVQPTTWRRPRTLLKLAAAFLLGLAVWLYFPVRSAAGPSFGPHDMNTLDGFLRHVLARGLTESLPFFGLADLPDRALVFWSLLRLQYSLAAIFLAVLAFVWLALPGERRPLLLLYGGTFLGNYLFVTNLRQQDIMAYLLGLHQLTALLAGLGILALVGLIRRRLRLERRELAMLLGALFLLGPALQLIRNGPVISLRKLDQADEFVVAVFEAFEGRGEGAVLLNDWEHMTPLWYSRFVARRWPNPADVRPALVATERPWLESVVDTLPAGPVYLSGYRPEIVQAGYRLRPRGEFYQVVEPGDQSIPPELEGVPDAAGGQVEIVAFDLPASRRPEGGDLLAVALALRAPAGTADYYVPVITIGSGANSLRYEFTTDSHLVTPQWRPGEVIVERFDVALPHDLPPGDYPVSVRLRNLTGGQEEGKGADLGSLTVVEAGRRPANAHLLANFRQRVGLASARARIGWLERRRAPWDAPLTAAPGDELHLTLEWLCLAPAEESYTVFVHLIDAQDRPVVTLDYTPLGGSAPTHLWIPKWLPGQRLLDPYRLEIPGDLPPGTYRVEVGLYEMTGRRRLHMADDQGNLIGDRFILGSVEVAGR